jgi:membrane protease YdiL (CAAX protease family)
MVNESPAKCAFDYFVLVFALAIPFWLAAAVLRQTPKEIPIDLPVSALAAFTPMIAALILTYRKAGIDGAKELLLSAVDYASVKDKRWYLPAIFLMPAAMLLEFGILRATGASLPKLQIQLLIVPILLLTFFAGAVGEELGWQGYAFDRLNDRWNALQAGLLLGLIWAIWHLIPFIQTNHSSQWIAWQCMATIVMRIVIVWLYMNAGRSLFIAVVFHAMSNMSEFLFPHYGSHYDPAITFGIMALASAVIIFLWGPRTLARFRYARPSPG